MSSLQEICSGIPLNPLPPKQEKRDPAVPHAPTRTPNLSPREEKVKKKFILLLYVCKVTVEPLQILSNIFLILISLIFCCKLVSVNQNFYDQAVLVALV